MSQSCIYWQLVIPKFHLVIRRLELKIRQAQMNPFKWLLTSLKNRWKDFMRPRRDLTDHEKKEFLNDLAGRLRKLLPDENVEGEPFWGLMEISAGKITGNYYVIQVRSPDFTMGLPLFFRETDADIFRETRTQQDKNRYVVRGFTKEQLRFLTFPGGNAKIGFMVFQKNPESGGTWPYMIYSPGDLAKEFLK